MREYNNAPSANIYVVLVTVIYTLSSILMSPAQVYATFTYFICC